VQGGGYGATGQAGYGNPYVAPQLQARAAQGGGPTPGHGGFMVDLLSAPCAEPLTCCCSMPFPCVAAHDHRLRLLDHDVSRYKCCNDRYSRCTSCLDDCTRGNEECCLWLEAICCHECAIYTNRAMIQERFGVRDSDCDQCLQGCVVFCQFLECLLRCAGHEDPNLRQLVDLIVCAMYSCMNAQHEHELNGRLGPSKAPPLLGEMAR